MLIITLVREIIAKYQPFMSERIFIEQVFSSDPLLKAFWLDSKILVLLM
jgi:hypothetical protein